MKLAGFLVTATAIVLFTIPSHAADSATAPLGVQAAASATASSIQIPAASDAILDLAMKVYGEHRLWRANVESDQSISSFAAKVKGTVAADGNDQALVDLKIDLTGMGLPNSQKAVMNSKGVWCEQSLFDKPMVMKADLPADESWRHEFLAQMILVGGLTIGRLDLAEQLWWFRHGWDLDLIDRDSLEVPGAIQLGGSLRSLTHAQEALIQAWPGSQLHQIDIFLSQDNLFPVKYRVSDLAGKPIWEVSFTEVQLGIPVDPATVDYAPPANTRVSNVTTEYAKTTEKRMRIRQTTQTDEVRKP